MIVVLNNLIIAIEKDLWNISPQHKNHLHNQPYHFNTTRAYSSISIYLHSTRNPSTTELTHTILNNNKPAHIRKILLSPDLLHLKDTTTRAQRMRITSNYPHVLRSALDFFARVLKQIFFFLPRMRWEVYPRIYCKYGNGRICGAACGKDGIFLVKVGWFMRCQKLWSIYYLLEGEY